MHVPSLDVLEVLVSEGRGEAFVELQPIVPYGVVPQVPLPVRKVVLGHEVIVAYMIPYDSVHPRHLRLYVLQGSCLTHRGHEPCVPEALAIQVLPHIDADTVLARGGLLDYIQPPRQRPFT